MSAETVTLSTGDGDFTAYLAHPASEPAAAIVVIQEIFGVNAFVREVCDRLAAQGYLAIAPDLFWRIEPGIDLTDHTDADWKRAFELYNAFDVDAGVKDIATTIDLTRPKSSGKVGAIGFCLGGREVHRGGRQAGQSPAAAHRRGRPVRAESGAGSDSGRPEKPRPRGNL